MKKLFSLSTRRMFISLIFILLPVFSFSQDISTLIKLNKVCVQLGSTRKLAEDTLQLQMNLSKVDYRMAPHLEFLLKAAEYYIVKDYEHSDYYIKQVRMNFRNIEYNNLKLLLMILNYTRAKNIPEAARHYYIVKKIDRMEPGSMAIIHAEIAGNIEKGPFDEELSHYFYYHQRLAILDTIYTTGTAENK